jgi:hypothetical protein
MVEIRGLFSQGNRCGMKKYDPACGAMPDAAACLHEMKVASPSRVVGETSDDESQMKKNFKARLMS